ncbi:hypothetical protein WJX81_004854 [Elliptochloris bilobata]|uniref:Uncharacterized protein n=1 Tax=Elliptochloris bilobata TaxID=381761 RepID=A0AAW1SJK6_9CHLO
MRRLGDEDGAQRPRSPPLPPPRELAEQHAEVLAFMRRRQAEHAEAQRRCVPAGEAAALRRQAAERVAARQRNRQVDRRSMHQQQQAPPRAVAGVAADRNGADGAGSAGAHAPGSGALPALMLGARMLQGLNQRRRSRMGTLSAAAVPERELGAGGGVLSGGQQARTAGTQTSLAASPAGSQGGHMRAMMAQVLSLSDRVASLTAECSLRVRP